MTTAEALELEGAKHRLEEAIRANHAFLHEHGDVVDGVFVFHSNIPPELVPSLRRELTALAVELDVAYRALLHAENNLAGGR